MSEALRVEFGKEGRSILTSRVVLDHDAMTVWVDGEEAYLPTSAYRVFCLLWEKRGKIVRHREIVEASVAFDDPGWYLDQLETSRGKGGDRQICSRSRCLISEIRKALGDAVSIGGRHGVGYRLEAAR